MARQERGLRDPVWQGIRTLISLVALMYVAFRQIAPGQDVGLDLAREYEMAVGMLEAGS